VTRRRLVAVNLLLAFLLAVHVADHVLHQSGGGELHGVAAAPGLLGGVAVVVSLVLLLCRVRHAELFASIVGFGTLAGFVAVHVLPRWSMFSDSYFEHGRDAVSWSLMLLPLAVAGLLGASAVRAATDRRV
jgi:hypothetical protein